MPTITKEQAFENIQKSCEERLNQIYCAGVPEFAKERLEKELKALSKSETIFQFEIYRIVAQAAKSESIPINTCNGTFIAYLIGYMLLNPLPAHYYCKNCGHSECNNDYNVFGMDLPKKKCACGNTMISMGIGIPYEFVWKNIRSMYYQHLGIGIIPEFIPIAEKTIGSFFSNPVFIIPDGTTSYPTEVSIFIENNSSLRIIYDFQRRTGIKAEEIEFSDAFNFNYHSLIEIRPNYKKLTEWFDELNPLSFQDFTRAFAFYKWQRVKPGYATIDEIKEMINSERFKKYPFAVQEDIFIYLIQNGVSAEDAYEMSNLWSDRPLYQLIEKYNFDNELMEILSGYGYRPLRFRHGSRVFDTARIYELMLIVKYLEILKK